MPRARLYFDYAASTPVAPEAEKAMRPYFAEKYGNAGSLHYFGQEAIRALDESREAISKTIGAGFREVVFTGSATEANNLALRGAVKAAEIAFLGTGGLLTPTTSTHLRSRRAGSFGDQTRRTSESFFKKRFPLRVIVSSIEHESVLETAHELEKDGVEVTFIPVSEEGLVDLKKLEESLNERTVLVSVMYANNEIGTIQPLFEIKKIINDFKKRKAETNSSFYPLFHTDAVQAFQFFDCDVGRLGVDLMTLSAHKIYGPKGAGALYARELGFKKKDLLRNRGLMNHNSYILNPIIMGGGQEFGIRSGTENIPLIVGFAKAAEIVPRLRVSESKRTSALRDYFWKELKKIYPRAERNGSARKTLPNFLNVHFPDYEAQDLLTSFDLAGLAASAGSACSARSSGPSYVIKEMGFSEKRARRSIRFTFGRPTSKKDIDSALKITKKLLIPSHGK
ncbi:MAG: cysteine desulfurase [Candidatus Liptonbacteria bacterium]|nr:cysteine desulfurase [Candidatus Liptonbacteria bacterium]